MLILRNRPMGKILSRLLHIITVYVVPMCQLVVCAALIIMVVLPVVLLFARGLIPIDIEALILYVFVVIYIILITVLSVTLYMLVKKQHKTFSQMQAVLKSCYIFGFFFIIVTFSLLSYKFIVQDKSMMDKNMMDKKIENMEINKVVKAEHVIDGQWDMVCVLTPYQTLLEDGGNEHIEDIKAINIAINNKRANRPSFIGAEMYWHLILKKSEKISFITEKRSRSFDIKQGVFSDELIALFSEMNFAPSSCANFKEAYFLKYEGHNQLKGYIFLSFGVKTS